MQAQSRENDRERDARINRLEAKIEMLTDLLQGRARSLILPGK